MSSNIVITLAAIGGIAWLGFILVNAIRRRGPEETPLQPVSRHDRRRDGDTAAGEQPEGSRPPLGVPGRVGPLYFLGEQDRQSGFEEQFDEESVARGAASSRSTSASRPAMAPRHRSVASFIEQRSGVEVQWEAPSLDDVFYRYEETK
jgi:hypothetical protein